MWLCYQTWLMLAGSCVPDEVTLVLVGSRVNNQLDVVRPSIGMDPFWYSNLGLKDSLGR